MADVDVVAITNSTIMRHDGIYQIKTLAETPDLKGVPHYVGHFSTIIIVERLGAKPSPNITFEGLEVGESLIAFTIKPGRSNRAAKNYTVPHQEVALDDLLIRKLERIE